MTFAEKTAIVSLCVAVYAAVVSTANSIIQFVNHRKDRADILVRVQRNMIQTDRMDQKYTIVTGVNRGKRPVTIQGFAARQLDTNINLMFLDIHPQVPRVLNEAESIAAWVPWVGGTDDLPNVETFFVYDSINREFCCHVVPWHRRLKSKYRRKHAADHPKMRATPPLDLHLARWCGQGLRYDLLIIGHCGAGYSALRGASRLLPHLISPDTGRRRVPPTQRAFWIGDNMPMRPLRGSCRLSN